MIPPEDEFMTSMAQLKADIDCADGAFRHFLQRYFALVTANIPTPTELPANTGPTEEA